MPYLNPLHPNIGIPTLQTILFTFSSDTNKENLIGNQELPKLVIKASFILMIFTRMIM